MSGQIDPEELLRVLKSIRAGDLSARMAAGGEGIRGEIARAVNDLAEELHSVSSEVARISSEMGDEGKFGGQAYVPSAGGEWRDMIDGLNSMARTLTAQIRDVTLVTHAVANGDLGKSVTVDAHYEMLDLKNLINAMVGGLGTYVSEITRVNRELGAEGRFGCQADVPGVAGVWKDLVDSTNRMASNLTDQVRNLSQVTEAIASGNFAQKATVDAAGETLQYRETLNAVVDRLNAYAREITRVSRSLRPSEGGQAAEPLDRSGLQGTWKDLLENVDSAIAQSARR